MTKFKKSIFNFALFFSFFLLELSSQSIIYVDASSDCPGDGTSWSTAYCNLQAALQAAGSGSQIWVAAGVYYPDRGPQVTLGSINESFRMENGVEIYGGFVGGETELDQRDYDQNHSILDGNIRNLNTIADNSNTVVNATGTDRSAVLDGFIVENGKANEDCSWTDPSCSGGNIFFRPGSPTLRNLIVRNGHASYGGGLSMLNNCNPLLENITFENNHAHGYGGAIHIRGNCTPEFYNCSFLSNTTLNHGAAIHCREASEVYFENCVFNDNYAEKVGGAMVIQANSVSEFVNCEFYKNTSFQGSGAIHYNDHSSGIFRNCVFQGNNAVSGNGGALSVHDRSSAQLYDCTFTGNSTTTHHGGAIRISNNSDVEIKNTQFLFNSTDSWGGAIFIFGHSSLLVEESYFYGNSCKSHGGAIFIIESSSLDLRNSSLIENTARRRGGAVALGDRFNYPSSLSIDSTFFERNTAELAGGAIYVREALDFSLRNSELKYNLAESGGGVYLRDNQSAEIEYCYIHGNSASMNGGGLSLLGDQELKMINCQITANKADMGGAFSLDDLSRLEAINITVAANLAEESGGGFCLHNQSSVNFYNSIVYNNLALNRINEIQSDAGSEFNALYSLVKNSTGNIGGQGQYSADPQTINLDPQFIDPVSAVDAPTAAGDFRLQSSSPAVDVGDNSLIVGYPVDLDFNPRILNDIVDMGAFENMRERCIEDIFLEVCPGESVYGIPIYNDTLFVENFIGADDCDSTIYTHVEVYEVPEPVLEVVSAPCTPDSTTIHLLNEDQFEVYSWSHGADSAEITVFESGTYTMHGLDSNGCPSQQSIDVEIYSPLEITLESSTNNNSFNFPDGSIEISIQGGAPPYEILWDNGQDSTYINGLLGGTYCVEILDQSGCVLEECFVIENNYPDLLMDYVLYPINCPEDEYGEINITISDGTPPIEVSVESEDGAIADSFRIDSIPFDLNLVQLPIGEYQVNIRDLLGQEVLFDFSIVAPPVIELLSTNIDMWPCDSLETLGKIEVESTGGTPPLVYHWNGEAGPEPALEFSEYGIYELIISDSLGCLSAPFEFEINEPEPLEVNIEYSGPECPGIEDGHILFSISGGTPPYTLYVNEEELPAPPFDLGELSPGEYEYLITDFTGCTLEGMVDLQYQNDYYLEIRESLTISLGDTVFLEGLTNMDGTLTEHWSPDALLRDDPPLGIWAFPFEDTTYELTLINEKGCVLRDSVHISVTPTDYEVYIPNAFSPNADGINDFFSVYAGSDVAVIQELIIFNRWGSVVWRNSHFRPNRPDYGWDGFFRGEKLQGGIYVYTASILFKNGISREYSGEFLLIE